MTRLSPLLLALAIALTQGLLALPPTLAEQYLLSAVNQERTSRGLAPLHLDPALGKAAALHAAEMARHRDIAHQFPGEPDLAARGSQVGARFSRIAENVAEGPTILGLHDALMRSPGHRANILQPEVDAVGIAVLSRNGRLYAVEDFQTTVKSLTLIEQEATVGLLLDAAGLDLLPGTNARRTCAQASGYAGDDRPAFVVRYTTDDLSQLPGKLKRRLALGQDSRAAVGACPSSRNSAFTEYSIAVVLYP